MSAGRDARTTADLPAITTPRLTLEPLTAAHAVEMVRVLAPPELYAFTGGGPPTLAELHQRYAVQAAGRSPDGTEDWCNWIVRDRRTGTAIGFVQATVRQGDAARTASVAWLITPSAQGRGAATEAATALVAWLRPTGIDVVEAFIHPDHVSSMGVARHCGLTPTGETVDGEVRWADDRGLRA